MENQSRDALLKKKKSGTAIMIVGIVFMGIGVISYVIPFFLNIFNRFMNPVGSGSASRLLSLIFRIFRMLCLVNVVVFFISGTPMVIVGSIRKAKYTKCLIEFDQLIKEKSIASCSVNPQDNVPAADIVPTAPTEESELRLNESKETAETVKGEIDGRVEGVNAPPSDPSEAVDEALSEIDDM